jgi:hypothetical protein
MWSKTWDQGKKNKERLEARNEEKYLLQLKIKTDIFT